MSFDRHLNLAWWALRLGLGVAPIVAGADKFFNLLADWSMYISPLAAHVIPIGPAAFMHIVGVVEIVAGIIVLTRWTRIGAYIVMTWLLAISINLLSTGMFYDVAVRDMELAIGAFALAQLTALREEAASAASGASSSQFAVTR